MGVYASGLRETFNDVINTYGRQVVINTRSASFTATDYDQGTMSTSGSVVGSGFVLPVSENVNGQDQQFMNMGVIRMDDFKMFLSSGNAINEDDLVVLNTGPNTGSYSVIKIFDYTVENGLVYSKIYMRRFTT